MSKCLNESVNPKQHADFKIEDDGLMFCLVVLFVVVDGLITFPDTHIFAGTWQTNLFYVKGYQNDFVQGLPFRFIAHAQEMCSPNLAILAGASNMFVGVPSNLLQSELFRSTTGPTPVSNGDCSNEQKIGVCKEVGCLGFLAMTSRTSLFGLVLHEWFATRNRSMYSGEPIDFSCRFGGLFGVALFIFFAVWR